MPVLITLQWKITPQYGGSWRPWTINDDNPGFGGWYMIAQGDRVIVASLHGDNYGKNWSWTDASSDKELPLDWPERVAGPFEGIY